MTTDIVTRLRAVAETGCDPDLPHDAAAEIERLRDALAIKTALLDEAPKNMAKLARIAAILEPLRALEAAATPGPWEKRAVECGTIEMMLAALYERWLSGPEAVTECVTTVAGEVAPCMLGNGPKRHDNGDFIAAARNALPALLREIQETP